MCHVLELEKAFGESIPIPQKLYALIRAIDAGEFEPDLTPNFYLALEPLGGCEPWFARPSTPSTAFAAKKLAVFGRGPDGSLYAVWEAPKGGFPVVFLDSEGDTDVLANDFDDFLCWLAVDNQSDEGDEDDDEAPDPLFQEWVRVQGLNIPTLQEDISDAAQQHADFTGWCDEASSGTLSAATHVAVETTKEIETSDRFMAPVPVGADLWDLMVAAIGQRIDSPIALALIEALDARPLRAATPYGETTYSTSKKFNIEISASCNVNHRAYWPERKQNRVYLTYIQRIMITQPSSVSLPHNLRWGMTEEELNAVGKLRYGGFDNNIPVWDFPSPRQHVCHPLARTNEQGLECLSLSLEVERNYITASADYEKIKPLVYVEKAFFTTWCALNGLLRPDKFTSEIVQPLQNRSITPLSFLHGPCERLLWSNDFIPDFLNFMSVYYLGIRTPDKQRWVSDVKNIFGESNCFRRDTDAMTLDTWDNYDRIAPVITKRFEKWQQSTLPTV